MAAHCSTSARSLSTCLPYRTLFKEPGTGIDFQFAGAMDYAPMTVRKSAFLDIGGIDEGAGEPGQCGIISDWDMSGRMWLAGWQMGYTWIAMQGDGVTGGWGWLAVHLGWCCTSLRRCLLPGTVGMVQQTRCCGAAVLRCCGAAVLRCCGAAVLRCCGAASLRSEELCLRSARVTAAEGHRH
jgi:hypothetical protein